MYNMSSASLAVLFDLLLNKDNPVIRPAISLRTTADKFEAFLPDELLACISPADSNSKVNRGGRPRKSPVKSSAVPLSDSSSWKKSSYLPFLYNAYKNARARREAMLVLLRKNPAKILLSAQKKAQSVLYPQGIPCFDVSRLEEVLTDPSCVPAALPQSRKQYIGHLHYYMRTNPERAFSRAFLSLLLADQYEECADMLFPPLDYDDNDRASLLYRADLLFQKGQYKQARDLYQAIADDASNPDCPEALLKIGKMYQYGYGFSDARSWSRIYFEEALQKADPQSKTFASASWELYHCETSVKKAFSYLEQAANCGSIDALRELGGMYYSGNHRFQVPSDQEKACKIYKKGAQANDAICARMYGRCLQNMGNIEEAKYWYFLAARQGDTEASVLWSELDALSSQKENNITSFPAQKPVLSSSDSLPELQMYSASPVTEQLDKLDNFTGVCVLNAENEMGSTFATSLPAGWATLPFSSLETLLLTLLKNDLFSNSSMTPSADTMTENSSARLIIFLSSEDEQINLADLDRAIFLLEHVPAKRSARKDLIAHTHFYIRTEYDDDLTIKMIDSFNSVNELRRKLAKNLPLSKTDQKDWFYHIRICNPARDASRYLLSHAPLFLPSIEDARQKPHVVIIGSSRLIPQLIADMLSVLPYTKEEQPLDISILSDHAEELRNRIEESMPELFADKSPISCNLSFVDLSEHALHEIFLHENRFFETTGRGWTSTHDKSSDNTGNNVISTSICKIYKVGNEKSLSGIASELAQKELQKILFEANYYVIAGNDETENIKTATWLRGALLTLNTQYGTLPFIAAYANNNLLSRQAAHFSVINEGLGFSWYNNYNLFCFGSSQELYTWQALEDNYLEKRSLALHKSYYRHAGNNMEQAEADYWCRFYNRDSSQMSALSAIYKAYLAGIVLKDWMEYGYTDHESLLSSAFRDWLKDPERLEWAAQMEHTRWNGFVSSRGWQQANIEQMRQYLRMGNPRLQLYIAKLHPCIVSWQRLPEIQRQYNEMQRQLHPEWRDRNLIQSDYDIVQLMPELLSIT